jgi:SpoVK/Ycf46/Vps4 family AAA+-type ATPase
VRTLFAVATYHQPSVVFIDEVDSLLTQRSSEENEASRRIKTEFLVQLDGAGTSADSRVVILGATNRPEELDEAARRRFVKRLYIPLPDISTRFELLTILLRDCKHSLIGPDISDIVSKTQGFSGERREEIASFCFDIFLLYIYF